MKSKKVNQNIKIVDVKRTVCLMLVMALLSTFSLDAQTVPDPPKPPKTTSISNSTSSHSIKIDTDNDQHNNSSVSISISDDSYRFKASYDKSKNEGVKAILLDELGEKNLTVTGNTYLWSDRQNGDERFKCKLTKGNLRIYLDKEAASKGFTEKIKKLGVDLKYYISGTSAKKENEKAVDKAKLELERAERELARAKREAERAAKAAKNN